MNFFKFKLKNKILIGVLAIASLVGAILIYFFYNITLDLLLTSSKRQLTYSAQNTAATISDVFEFDRHSADTMSSMIEFKEYLSGSQPTQDLKILSQLEAFKTKGNYYAASIVNATGTVLVSTNPEFVNLNVSNREYFISGSQGKSSVMMAFGLISKRPRYYFSSPIKSADERFLGEIVLILEGSTVDELINKIAKSDEKIMFTDKDGIILSSNKPDRIYKSLGTLSPEKIDQIKQSNVYLDAPILPLKYDPALNVIKGYKQIETISFFEDDDKAHETVVISKINDLPFFLVDEFETEDVFAAAYRTATVVSLIILFAIVLKFLLIAYLIERSLNPISDLALMAKNIGSGKFDQKNIIVTNDEFYELGNVLERVSAQLGGLYNNLELKVKERTAELEKNNEELKISEKNLKIAEKNSENLAKELLKFKMAVDSTSEHVVITDSEGVVVYGNKAMENITGYSVKEALGTKAGKLWSYPMPKDYYEKLWKTIKVEKKPFYGEITNRRKNGEIYQAVVSISPVVDKSGAILYFVGLERDVTLEKNIDRAKTEFVSLASHQLRTPLTTISWYAEMLSYPESGKLNKKQKEFLGEIYEGNKRMIELVNTLLNVSRIELGSFAIEPKKAVIRDIYTSVLKELKPEIKKKKIRIDENYDEKIGEMNLDEKLLRMVFQNLLTNAVKYMEKGKIAISIKKKMKEVEVSISDTGFGIPKVEQEKIFSKLFRATNARMKDSSGTGLGLYIVKSIIEQSGGKIWFESEESVGTTFYFTIPLSGMKSKQGSRPLS